MMTVGRTGNLWLWTGFTFLGLFLVKSNAFSTPCESTQSGIEENSDFVTVRVEQGLLRGKRAESVLGGFYYSFQGIPYAKPPIGSRRFKDPEPPSSWRGVRDAISVGNICPQPNINLDDGIIGNEDCLYLNVYSPNLPPAVKEPLPVMIWFHGGGFAAGGANNDTYPDYLVAEDIIVVTTNYRLSSLGFLYLNEAVPGNAGMKDQVAALRWVQKNIAALGGNPKKVTIVGQSAGGASVHLHMLSPMTKGLFHGAIAESGNALNMWAIPTDPLEVSRRLATVVGCTDADDFARAECLRKVDAATLVDAAFRNASLEVDRDRLSLFVFVPSVDFPVIGVERFMPAPAIDLITAGQHHPVPYMTGFNNNESIVIGTESVNIFDPTIGRRVDCLWNTEFLPELRLPRDNVSAESALQDLRNFYMNGMALSSDTMKGFTEMLTDIYFGEGIYYTLKHMAKKCSAPIYYYSFTIDDELNIAKVLSRATEYVGANHGDEMGYLFRMEALPTVAVNSSAWLTRQIVVRLWTNFIKYGNPTPVNDPLLEVQWKQYSEESRNFLEIGSQLIPATDHNAERVAFWENFYQKYGSEGVN